MLRLAVTVVGKMLELSANAKTADVFLGSLGWNLQLFGYGKIGFAVELLWKVVEKCLFDNGWGIAVCGRFGSLHFIREFFNLIHFSQKRILPHFSLFQK